MYMPRFVYQFIFNVFLKIFIFIYYFLFGCTMLVEYAWDHVGSPFLTRDQTQAPCIGSIES